MALENKSLLDFINAIQIASNYLKSDELVYTSEWLYDLPTHSLEINNQMLLVDYEIPTGWDGFGIDDLNELEKRGILSKTFESAEDPVLLSKVIKYKIQK